MSKTQTDKQVVRCLRLTELLFRRVIDGISVSELASAGGYSAPNVCRDMALLESAGWAQKLETGRWAVTSKPVALMRAYELHMATTENRIREFQDNVNARAMRVQG